MHDGSAVGGAVSPAEPTLAKYKNIAVLGSHPVTKMQAPFADPDWTIWACSPHNFEKERLPRVDEWFEVHVPAGDKETAVKLEEWMNRFAPAGEVGKIKLHPEHGPLVLRPPTRSPEYLAFVRELTTQMPVWMRDREGFPDAKQYPEKEMKARFSPFHFTSSIAFILAKAIVEKPKSIGLWGIMQASPNEYCAVPETRALSADLRWVSVGDLKLGDELLAFDESSAGNRGRQWRKATVDAAGLKKMPCYRMDMADGTSLVSSAAHKWLNAEYQWVESRRVRGGGDYPSATRVMKLLEPWLRDESWDAGYLAAAVDGDGHLVQYQNGEGENSWQCRVGFGQRDNDMLRQVDECARRLGFEFSHGKHHASGVFNCNLLGGKSKTLEFLGRVRPPRLLGKFNAETIGEMRARSFVPVENVEAVGDKEVVTLSTSTGTFIAEGFASHNTFQRPGIQYFLWEAKRLGIDVFAPEESRLFELPPENW